LTGGGRSRYGGGVRSGRVVVVTGPPGAGKSTVARALAERAGEPGGVHLHGDDVMLSIRHGFIPPHLPASAHQNRTLSRALAAAACTFAQGGYLVALDWVVGPWFVDAYREAAVAADVPLDYVVLRPSEATVVARARDRAAMPVVDYGHLRPLYAQLSELGALEAHVLDTTTWSVAETVASVDAGLADGRFRLA
jgi:predicted kinase